MSPLPRRRRGFSLVELLVVIAIIVVLIGLLMPAVQSAREAARRAKCESNLKQMALATLQFENVNGTLPPQRVWDMAVGDNSNNWSAQSKILPWMEQTITFNNINFNVIDDNSLLPNSTLNVQTTRIPTFVCPAEVNDTARITSSGSPPVLTPKSWPCNYAMNLGTWFIYDPTTNSGGAGAFFPNASLKIANFTDGTSQTLLFAEVKAFQPAISGAALASVPALPSKVNATTGMLDPTQVTALGGTPKMGQILQNNTGHTAWGDGRGVVTGFTTTFQPNQVVAYTYTDGSTYDVDWINQSEGSSNTIPSFSALTSRSYHPGLVNAVFVDGSVHQFTNNTAINVWQALSTRAGAEQLSLNY